MRTSIIFMVGLCILLAGISVVGTTDEHKKSESSETISPPADGKAFWKYITETNPYRGWAIYPGYEELIKGESHSVWLKTYANGIAMKAIREGKKELPYGSIIVKDNFAEDKTTLKVVSPMYRVKGFNPEGDDWFWVKFGPDGKVMAEGKVKACVDCHKRADNWIFSKYEYKEKMEK